MKQFLRIASIVFGILAAIFGVWDLLSFDLISLPGKLLFLVFIALVIINAFNAEKDKKAALNLMVYGLLGAALASGFGAFFASLASLAGLMYYRDTK